MGYPYFRTRIITFRHVCLLSLGRLPCPGRWHLVNCPFCGVLPFSPLMCNHLRFASCSRPRGCLRVVAPSFRPCQVLHLQLSMFCHSNSALFCLSHATLGLIEKQKQSWTCPEVLSPTECVGAWRLDRQSMKVLGISAAPQDGTTRIPARRYWKGRPMRKRN